VPRQAHNTPLPLKRSPPVSFKRLLGARRKRAGYPSGYKEKVKWPSKLSVNVPRQMMSLPTSI